MRVRRLAIALLLPLVLATAGCTDPYGGCSKAGADIASVITAGDNTIIQLQQGNLITGQEAINVLGYLEFANKADEAFLTCAKTAHTNGNVKGSYTACTAVFASTINNPTNLALLHVTNASSQATVSAIVNSISVGIAGIATALGGA